MQLFCPLQLELISKVKYSGTRKYDGAFWVPRGIGRRRWEGRSENEREGGGARKGERGRRSEGERGGVEGEG